jgi:hypothetical protein
MPPAELSSHPGQKEGRPTAASTQQKEPKKEASMTLTIQDVLAANSLLVSLGAEDQMPRLAMTALERSLDLQSRIDRALAYAESAPPASTHARQIARILDGSITVDDELNEVQESGLPMQRRRAVEAPPAKKPDKSPRGKLKPGHGLGGRSTKERLKIRAWIEAQGYDIAHSGRIPQVYLDEYDEAMAEERRQKREANQSQQAAF